MTDKMTKQKTKSKLESFVMKIISFSIIATGIYSAGVLLQREYALQMEKEVPIEVKNNSAKEYMNYWERDNSLFKFHPIYLGNYLASKTIINNKNKFGDKISSQTK